MPGEPEDVLGYLGEADYEIGRAERVARAVTDPKEPEETVIAWDALVQLTRV